MKKLPDFILVGAMKSGTTSMYNILKNSSQISTPLRKEIKFFNQNDFNIRGRYLLFEDHKTWKNFDWNNNSKKLIEKYSENFSDNTDKLNFEASTNYYCSEKAAKRIYNTIPKTKLIFMLRNPIDRAYSHYKHWVKTGRAIYNFENQIKYETPNIITQGFYKNHIKNYLNYFSKDQIHIIIFEEFIKDMNRILNELFNFLNIKNDINLKKIKTYKNSSLSPRFLKIQLLINFFSRFLGKKMTTQVISNEKKLRNKIGNIIFYISKKINFTNKKYPKMNSKTEQLLKDIYERENHGLSSLINKNLKKTWNLNC